MLLKGTHAVLGMDVVGYSQLSNQGQEQAIAKILEWISGALGYYNIKEGDFRWSPAGDGGYITFASPEACARAVDVGLSIAQHLEDSQDRRDRLKMRFAVHAGQIVEAPELGGSTNILGEGINTAARILTVSGAGQILVSDQYFDIYINGKRENLQCSDAYYRTVKHGVEVRVRNVHRGSLGIDEKTARSQRWFAIGDLWAKAIREYEFLITDAMNSADPVAALAAAKFLMGLDPASNAGSELLDTISDLGPDSARYRKRTHRIFSALPRSALRELMRLASVRIYHAGQFICRDNEVAENCFFPIYGRVEVELPIDPKPTVPPGEIVGEFGLWIPNIRRTASLRARDECLLLEIGFSDFRNICEKSQDVDQAITATIRARVQENVANSGILFPGLTDQQRQMLKERPVECQKCPARTKLNLTTHTHILFAGEVQITPEGRRPIEFDARARFGHERVIGIHVYDDPADVDGTDALVLEESVVVSIPRALLEELQRTCDQTHMAWGALKGARATELRRLHRQP
jgi:class 3 adenylate cyclase/CRP-like cAMP-binding protein